ncbi:hypothetical protein HGRIS_004526 [Hohenbuehelia grisea]|uniref:Uncharacterized protein n=1 Tax=Hohenbuehelia grisea TaxID=104357 RepID=A0ABR3JDC8_9AGAR
MLLRPIGDWRYVYPTEIATFGSVAERQKMLASGRIGRSWAHNYTTAARLPLHPFLGPPNTPYPSLHIEKEEDFEDTEHALSHSALSFVHGGLAPHYGSLSPFPSSINDLGASLLRKLQNRPQPQPHPPYPYPGLPADTTPTEAALYSGDGPLWYRGWAMEAEAKVCAEVDAVLKKTGTRRMIMGHTPDFTVAYPPFPTLPGVDCMMIIRESSLAAMAKLSLLIQVTELFVVNVNCAHISPQGISHAYGGVLSALSIHYTLTPVSSEDNGDPSQKKWREREVVSALYPDRQVILVDDEKDVHGDFDALSYFCSVRSTVLYTRS